MGYRIDATELSPRYSRLSAWGRGAFELLFTAVISGVFLFNLDKWPDEERERVVSMIMTATIFGVAWALWSFRDLGLSAVQLGDDAILYVESAQGLFEIPLADVESAEKVLWTRDEIVVRLARPVTFGSTLRFRAGGQAPCPSTRGGVLQLLTAAVQDARLRSGT